MSVEQLNQQLNQLHATVTTLATENKALNQTILELKQAVLAVPAQVVAQINAAKQTRASKTATAAPGTPAKPRTQVVQWLTDEAKAKGEAHLTMYFGSLIADLRKTPEHANSGVDAVIKAAWQHLSSYAKLRETDLVAQEKSDPQIRLRFKAFKHIHDDIKTKFAEYKKQHQAAPQDFSHLGMSGNFQLPGLPSLPSMGVSAPAPFAPAQFPQPPQSAPANSGAFSFGAMQAALPSVPQLPSLPGLPQAPTAQPPQLPQFAMLPQFTPAQPQPQQHEQQHQVPPPQLPQFNLPQFPVPTQQTPFTNI